MGHNNTTTATTATTTTATATTATANDNDNNNNNNNDNNDDNENKGVVGRMPECEPDVAIWRGAPMTLVSNEAEYYDYY